MLLSLGWRNLARHTAATAVALATALSATVQAQVIGVAARVNGAEISVFRLERHFEEFMRGQRRDANGIRHPNVYKRLKREALDELIDRELLCQQGRRAGLEVAPAEVQAVFAALAAQFDSEDALRRRLQRAGFDARSYQEYLACDLLAQRSFAHLAGTAHVSDEEVLAYLKRHHARFVHPERVRASHILRRSEGPESDAAARALLDELRRQVLAGADFASLARAHSEDASADRGGDLGYLSRSQILPELGRAAFSLTPGKVSQPVRSRYGWHLIRADSRLPPEAMPASEAQSLARTLIEGERRIERGQQALRELREAARIEHVLPL